MPLQCRFKLLQQESNPPHGLSWARVKRRGQSLSSRTAPPLSDCGCITGPGGIIFQGAKLQVRNGMISINPFREVEVESGPKQKPPCTAVTRRGLRRGTLVIPDFLCPGVDHRKDFWGTDKKV
jgi:hypothetical protein